MTLCFHCAVAFGWTPAETLAQDELMVNDMLRMDRQINYLKWANRHGVEGDEPASFGPNVLDYRQAFGAMSG